MKKMVFVVAVAAMGIVGCISTGTNLGHGRGSPAPALELPPAPALEPTPAPALELPPAPALEPTPAPALEPTPAPALEPTPAPALDPTPAPPLELTPAPALEPTPAPALEPTPAPPLELTPARVPAPPPAPAVRTKVFEIPPPQGGSIFRNQGIEVGDCVMFRAGNGRPPAKVTLYSDGRIHFDATVRSEDSGDEFHIQFWAVDAAGKFLFKYYPAMSQRLPRSSDVGWHLRDGTFPAEQFDHVSLLFWASPGCH
ncbi:DUF6294 family protein [Myxococcus fulvus]|uniref:DUF6294 family protein n=1 Tax=Myxococcus fulvus TaxID=33 RepID=UPI003B9969DC